MTDPHSGPDQPTIDPPADVSALTEADRELNAALVNEISDGAGVESFDQADWTHYAKAILLERGVDPVNVVVIASDDGVTLEPVDEYLERREAIAATADLASRYLRRCDGWTASEIDRMSDLEIVRLFLRRKGYLPVDNVTTEDATE